MDVFGLRDRLIDDYPTYWREVEAAIQSGKPVLANVLAEYRKLKGNKQSFSRKPMTCESNP